MAFLKLIVEAQSILAALIWFSQGSHAARFSESLQAPLVFYPSVESRSSPIASDSDTSNLIFGSFVSLLQQWPNTFASSGHSIIAGVIPVGTRLYHGCNNGDPQPQGMEWLAFDPEMSYAIHSIFDPEITYANNSFGEGGMELLTYTAYRSLRVIYLDGQSSALGAGWMDSQSVLINGTVNEKFIMWGSDGGDRNRARDLCKIGKSWGFEGVVRMSSGFELIWCDFNEGIKLIDRVNATDPFMKKPLNESSHGETSPKSPFYGSATWAWVQSATQHYHAPGEVRLKLDASTFISFYDRIESLTRKRITDRTAKAPRSKHRLYGISRQDAHTISNRLKSVLARKNIEGWSINQSGVDWRSVALSITQKYSHRLEELAFTLKLNQSDPITTALDVRWMSYGLLMPYVDFTNFSSTNRGWIEPSLERCTTAFTTGQYEADDQNESIKVIIGAIEGTLRGLCSTLIKIFGETIEMDLPGEPLIYNSSNKTIETGEIEKKVQHWTILLDEMMSWLGWSTWDRCEPACAPNVSGVNL